jgi:hypothetical protein
MWGVLPVNSGEFEPASHNIDEVSSSSLIAVAMAACHTLTIIDGALLGDPLDVKVLFAI